MTAIIPDEENTLAHFSVPMDPAGSDPITTSKNLPLAGLKHLTFYFGDADNTEIFKTPAGTVAVAFQPVSTSFKSTASVGSTGIIFTGGNNSAGWLHVLTRGSLRTGTTTEAPFGRGNAGYVPAERSIFLNHWSATPNNLTQAKIVPKLGLRLRIFRFATTANTDTFECESARLCPGVVATAWQTNTPSEDVIVTQNAAGDVVFTSTAGSADFGWLWAWSRR